MDPGFFYETVAPLLIVGNTSLIAISTLTSEINFYSRLLRMRDKVTNLPLFSVLSVTLACAKCREDGKAADCAHMLHLVPRWQSGDRHVKLKTVMQDRPDLIESELSGLAFDSLQQVFKSVDMEIMFSQTPPPWITNDVIHLFIDPAAEGPGSDYAILSVSRQKGLITVKPPVQPPAFAPESRRRGQRVGHRHFPNYSAIQFVTRAQQQVPLLDPLQVIERLLHHRGLRLNITLLSLLLVIFTDIGRPFRLP